jgi:hypothetical protein
VQSVLSEVSKIVTQHAADPAKLREFGSHMRDNGPALAKSIIRD